MNLVLFIVSLSILIFIHEFGHFLFAKMFNVYCLEFSIGMGPSIVSKKLKFDKETTYSLRWLPIGGYVSMAGETENDKEKELDIPHERTINGINPWKRAIITIAGIAFNFIFAIIILIVVTFAQGVPTNDNQISVVSNSIASEAKLSSKDKIVGVKDIVVKDKNNSDYVIYQSCKDSTCNIYNISTFSQYVNDNEMVEAINEYVESRSEEVKIEQTLMVFYKHKGTDAEIPTVLSRNYANNSFELFGINEGVRTPGFFEGIGYSFREFGNVIVLMGKALGSLFAPGGFDNLGGVVAMYKSSELMVERGIVYYLWYMAIISINLGFFNLLPIPALDGARFYMSIFEGISKKKVNPKVEGWLNMTGLILLFGLMIVVTIKDIVTFF